MKDDGMFYSRFYYEEFPQRAFNVRIKAHRIRSKSTDYPGAVTHSVEVDVSRLNEILYVPLVTAQTKGDGETKKGILQMIRWVKYLEGEDYRNIPQIKRALKSNNSRHIGTLRWWT